MKHRYGCRLLYDLLFFYHTLGGFCAPLGLTAPCFLFHLQRYVKKIEITKHFMLKSVQMFAYVEFFYYKLPFFYKIRYIDWRSAQLVK